ncbi:DUF6265 family protein [Tenacibaculum insulae]|uniref:DUF6265 family protein n=1 Tax=Tenacibaculum insulae TaxID=2029677 RepID=UPI003AB502EA
MRLFSLLLVSFLLFSCNTKKKNKKPTWLIGKWERINEKPTKNTYEFWINNLTGTGFTLQQNDTIFKEIMSIATIKDTLHLKVEGVNEKPTLFKFTQQTDTSFVAKNPTHDFPTEIKYWIDNEKLKARVSNKKFGIDFVFKKMN